MSDSATQFNGLFLELGVRTFHRREITVLTKDDIKGVAAMVPTPCKENAEGWDATDSLELDETARMTENYIRAGIGVIAACGTTGECAALLWEEKRAFVDAIVLVNRKRVPVFAGATALGTKETIQQMRGLRDVGADGAFVGLPLWQTPTIENAVKYYADLGEAVPDMPILVYANARVFKSDFPHSGKGWRRRRAPLSLPRCLIVMPTCWRIFVSRDTRLISCRVRVLSTPLTKWRAQG